MQVNNFGFGPFPGQSVLGFSFGIDTVFSI